MVFEKLKNFWFNWGPTVIALVVALGILVVLCFGCAPKPVVPVGPVVPIIPVQPIQNLTKIVTQTNWLMVVALGMFTWGVMSIFSGNTKGGVFIAGSLALAGGIAALTVGNELLIAWLPFMKWAIPAGAIGALAFYIYNHNLRTTKIVNGEAVKKVVTNLVDYNKDGKIDIEDLKIALGLEKAPNVTNTSPTDIK